MSQPLAAAAESAVAPAVIAAEGWTDYALLDSGHGRKLERYGSILVVRPEEQAMWAPTLPAARWGAAHAVFTGSGEDEEGAGRWRIDKPMPEAWTLSYDGLAAICRLSSFRHLGIFPEQRAHWDWAAAEIQRAGRPVRVLNLFGYTGLASLSAAQAGAQVTHVDASKKAIAWARENQAESGLDAAPIRWILDDAVKFAAREVRRGSRYDGIILDPPKFGRGPKGEEWHLFRDLPEMLALVRAMLAERPRFVILTAYALRTSSLAFARLAAGHLGDLGGSLAFGELALAEESAGQDAPRLLPTSHYVRWSAT